MSSRQKTYRVYGYDAAHKVLTSDCIDAASDEEAIAKASAAGFGSRCEIWEDRRLIAELKGEAQAG
jgi:hypothetical protein